MEEAGIAGGGGSNSGNGNYSDFEVLIPKALTSIGI